MFENFGLGGTGGGGGFIPSDAFLSNTKGANLKTLNLPPATRLALDERVVNAMQGIGANLKKSVKPIPGDELLGKTKNVLRGGYGKALPLFALLDVASELTDETEPFQKNLAQGLGSAGGSVGGALAGATVAGPVGAVLGALLMSNVGRELAGGAYKVVNPEGQLNYAIKQLEKQKKYQLAKDEVNREIALQRARDQQVVDTEAAIINAALGR
jgi:hypothetical protein|tara:strand:+ start:196 stop:834 length:639 start_codon:yes stop_codon:yes gene_type:complete